MNSIIFDGNAYQVGTSEDGSPRQLSRYNEATNVRITLNFSKSMNPALMEEVQQDLKDLYLKRTMSLLEKN